MKDIKMATGVVLVDAPASALNNAGIEPGRMAENKVVVKKIRYRGRDQYPYVSGQAFKRWWRETIHQKFNWNPSPIFREEKVAYTEANPINYEEDDVFGYMLAPKQKVDEIGMVSGLSYRRIAPLKCTPLISIFSNVTTDDFGVFTRGNEAKAEPVPYEQEFYSTILKGTFSLMLNETGVFYQGRAKDLPAENDADDALAGKTKDEKIKKQIVKFKERVKAILTDAKNKKATINGSTITLQPDERKKRVKETLLCLPELTGGAKGAIYLTDISPRFIIATVINCANHIFMDVVKTKDATPSLDIEVLKEIVKDYKNCFISPIYIGLRRGFFNEEEYAMISKMCGFKDNKGVISIVDKNSAQQQKPDVSVVFGTPKEVIAALTEHIEKMNL